MAIPLKILFYFYFIQRWELENTKVSIIGHIKIQRKLMDQFNTEYKVSTKNFLYFLNLHCSYFIISLDQYRLNLI